LGIAEIALFATLFLVEAATMPRRYKNSHLPAPFPQLHLPFHTESQIHQAYIISLKNFEVLRSRFYQIIAMFQLQTMLDFTLDDLATENASTGSTPPRPQPHPIDPVSKGNKSKCDAGVIMN
jgi:hypothetical protein